MAPTPEAVRHGIAALLGVRPKQGTYRIEADVSREVVRQAAERCVDTRKFSVRVSGNQPNYTIHISER